MLRAAVSVRRQKLRGGWRWAVILQCDPQQSWKHRKPRVSLHTKWWITIPRHFLRAVRTTLNGLTAHWHCWKTDSTCEWWVWNNLQMICPPWLGVRDLQAAERGNLQPSKERFMFLPGSSGTTWSLQKDGMFSMTEGISWLSPGASEHCVHCRNAV